MRKLILCVGLPKSGKTTWARQQGHPIVNPDSIRLALHGQRFVQEAEPFVWAIAYLMVDALFKAGHDTVIVDATNNTFKRRQAWFDKFQSAGTSVEPEYFHVSAEECIDRAKAQNDLEIIPTILRMEQERDWHT